MALPSPTGRVVSVIITGLHAELLSYPRHSLGADFRRRLWKPSMCSMKQEQQGKSETVGDILRHDERLVLRRQRPRRDDVSVIQSHILGIREEGARRETPKFCDSIECAANVALIDNWHYFLIANWHDLVLVQGIKKEVRSRLCGSFTRRAS